MKDLTCTFRASCYSARLSWALVLTWVSPFVQDKNVGFWVGGGGGGGRERGNRLSRYDIRAEGALPPSITMITRVKHLGYWICNMFLRINSKIEICALRTFYEGDCSANFEWMFPKH